MCSIGVVSLSRGDFDHGPGTKREQHIPTVYNLKCTPLRLFVKRVRKKKHDVVKDEEDGIRVRSPRHPPLPPLRKRRDVVTHIYVEHNIPPSANWRAVGCPEEAGGVLLSAAPSPPSFLLRLLRSPFLKRTPPTTRRTDWGRSRV